MQVLGRIMRDGLPVRYENCTLLYDRMPMCMPRPRVASRTLAICNLVSTRYFTSLRFSVAKRPAWSHEPLGSTGGKRGHGG